MKSVPVLWLSPVGLFRCRKWSMQIIMMYLRLNRTLLHIILLIINYIRCLLTHLHQLCIIIKICSTKPVLPKFRTAWKQSMRLVISWWQKAAPVKWCHLVSTDGSSSSLSENRDWIMPIMEMAVKRLQQQLTLIKTVQQRTFWLHGRNSTKTDMHRSLVKAVMQDWQISQLVNLRSHWDLLLP